MNDRLSDSLFVIYYIFFAFFLLLIGSYYFFNYAWIEWELSEKLLQEGLPTQAVMQSCTIRGKHCSTTYQYKVPSSDQKNEVYTIREPVCDCQKKGQKITVFYLPGDPSQAKSYIRHDEYFNFFMIANILMMWSINLVIFLFFLFIPHFLRSRLGIWLINCQKCAFISLLLFIFMLSSPGFIIGTFIDLKIFKYIYNYELAINFSSEMIKICITLFFLCHVRNSSRSSLYVKFDNLILSFMMINLTIGGGELWFIFNPIIMFFAKNMYFLINPLKYQWSLILFLLNLLLIMLNVKNLKYHIKARKLVVDNQANI